jgi:hypothetical protein
MRGGVTQMFGRRGGQQTATRGTRHASTQSEATKATTIKPPEKPSFDTWDFMVLDVRFLLEYKCLFLVFKQERLTRVLALDTTPI